MFLNRHASAAGVSSTDARGSRARHGLKSLAEKLMAMHMRHCIEHAGNPAAAKRKLREIAHLGGGYMEEIRARLRLAL